MIKIIYIISFCPKYEYQNSLQPDHFWTNKKGEQIGVWRADWGHVFAKNVKKFFPEVEFEVWRPDYRAEREYVHVFDDGVLHRSFPSQKVKFRKGLRLDFYETSIELIENFALIANKHQDTKDLVCHLPLDFSYLGYVLLKNFRNKLPFLHTSHLNPDLLNVDFKTLNPFKLIHRLLIKRTYDQHKMLLGDIAVSPDRIEFFKTYTRSNIYQLDSLNFDFEWTKNKIPKEEARKRHNLNTKAFIILYSSRLVPEKQLDKMIKSLAMIKNRNFLCIISGSGELNYQNELKELVNRLDLNKQVSFVGYLTDELIDYYCASDVFISTSISEGGPVSAIKAMALNIPIISTNTGIVYYLLKVNNAGIILDKNDPVTWAKKIEKVILGEKIKIVNSDRLEEEFELKKSIQQLVGCYHKAIENFWTKKAFSISEK